MEDKIDTLNTWIEQSHNIVFFGGAGVSTESGIPDFRSKDGLYSKSYVLPPEEILSISCYQKHPDIFYQFYRDNMNTTNYLPNITHKKLAALEKSGKLACIITQNIDGLHQKAGSQQVLELHGSIYRNYCQNCHAFYPETAIFKTSGIPTCHCGGTIKPDVVLYGEDLDQTVLQKAILAIQQADLLIIGGTSLNVFPASSLIYYFRGWHLALINQESTIYDDKVGLLIQESLGKVFKQMKE